MRIVELEILRDKLIAKGQNETDPQQVRFYENVATVIEEMRQDLEKGFDLDSGHLEKLIKQFDYLV